MADFNKQQIVQSLKLDKVKINWMLIPDFLANRDDKKIKII